MRKPHVIREGEPVRVVDFGLSGWAGVQGHSVITRQFRTEAEAQAAVWTLQQSQSKS